VRVGKQDGKICMFRGGVLSGDTDFIHGWHGFTADRSG